MNQEELSKLIEKGRKDKGLTQQELAKILGVSNTAISKWENGNNFPDISLYKPISEALDIPIKKLMDIENINIDDDKESLKLKKNRIINKIIITIITLVTIIGTNYLTYSRFKREELDRKSKSVKVYSIEAFDQDFKIEGFIIYNEEESNIIFNQFEATDRNQGIEEEKEYSEMKITLKINDEVINKQVITDNKKENINTLIKNIPLKWSDTNNLMYKYDNNINNLTIEISPKEKNKDPKTKIVKLTAKMIFT